MFQMKWCKWDFGDIKSVIHIKVLFFLMYPSSWIITIEAREINIRPTKVIGRRELSVYRRLRLLSVFHGWMLKMEVRNIWSKSSILVLMVTSSSSICLFYPAEVTTISKKLFFFGNGQKNKNREGFTKVKFWVGKNASG